MTDTICSDLVRFGGDINLAPVQLHDDLNAHLEMCIDCSTYVAQMAATRDVLVTACATQLKDGGSITLRFEIDRYRKKGCSQRAIESPFSIRRRIRCRAAAQ